MKNRLFIDGRDAFNEYGIFVEQGGYKQVIQFPAFKSLDTTEWPDEDGIEVDLESPRLDSRTLQIQFCVVNLHLVEQLLWDLSNGAYHIFEFREIGRSYKLRMTQNGSFKSKIRLGKLTLSFADDFPVMPDIDANVLGNAGIRQKGYVFDGIDLSQYGVYVLDGSDESIRKAANVRENLKISTKDIFGVIYDNSTVKFRSKDVTLRCLIHCHGIEEFWRRYYALFASLLAAGEHTIAAIDKEFTCHYKSMNVSKFDIISGNRVWCEFSVILTIINYRPKNQYKLLAAENGSLIITEREQANIALRPHH